MTGAFALKRNLFFMYDNGRGDAMTRLTDNTLARPWHREPWPWILMAGPAIVIVAGFTTLWLAISSDDGLVADDYYRRGLAINQTLSRGQAARDLGLSAEVMMNEGVGRVRVSMHGGTALPEILQMRLVHPTRAIADQRLELRKVAPGSYAGTLNAPLGGRRVVFIEDTERHWRLAGEAPGSGQDSVTAVPQ
jgi:hypothetical protein